jgi:hypothetical protein
VWYGMTALHGSVAICTGPAGSPPAARQCQQPGCGRDTKRALFVDPYTWAGREPPVARMPAANAALLERRRSSDDEAGGRLESVLSRGRGPGVQRGPAGQRRSRSKAVPMTPRTAVARSRRPLFQPTSTSPRNRPSTGPANPSAATHRMRLTQCSNMQLCNRHPALSTSAIVAAVIAVVAE